MGIRHQVYLRLNQDQRTEESTDDLLGIHIQVCDGYDALQLLCNLLDFTNSVRHIYCLN